MIWNPQSVKNLNIFALPETFIQNIIKSSVLVSTVTRTSYATVFFNSSKTTSIMSSVKGSQSCLTHIRIIILRSIKISSYKTLKLSPYFLRNRFTSSRICLALISRIRIFSWCTNSVPAKFKLLFKWRLKHTIIWFSFNSNTAQEKPRGNSTISEGCQWLYPASTIGNVEKIAVCCQRGIPVLSLKLEIIDFCWNYNNI